MSTHPREGELAPAGAVTRLLAELRGGDPAALDELFSLVYRELRGEAHRRLRFLHGPQTLSTTALVHETYLKLVGTGSKDWQDRGHFFAVAARAMRQIVVDHARRHRAAKRGRGEVPELLEEGKIGTEAHLEELLAVDEALAQLQALDARLGQLVELRFFAGLSVEETAEGLGLSPRTVKRDWRKARAFLYRLLAGQGAPPPASPAGP